MMKSSWPFVYFATLWWLLLPAPASAQTESRVRALMEKPVVKTALSAVEAEYEEILRDVVAITEIPSPVGKEQARAKFVAARFRDSGLKNVTIDDEGNVLGEYPGSNTGPTIALAAHLDTVFAETVDTHVKKNGNIYSAPGIGDDAYGVAVMIAVARSLTSAQVRTHGNILFVADVGEEGLGNLRGMRYLFEKSPWRGKINTFISLEGPGDSVIVNGGVASKRYRVTYHGPGGNSYAAFGLVNPAFAMGGTIQRISRFQVPKTPHTTFSVGLVGGGTSVNSIPAMVWMEVDLRSESTAELAKLETQFLVTVRLATAEENHSRSTANGAVTSEAKLVGERKGGQTPPTSAVVQNAIAVNRIFGKASFLQSSSSDANVPMALGIPAITIGAGSSGGRSHSQDEWLDVGKAGVVTGTERVLLLALSLASVD